MPARVLPGEATLKKWAEAGHSREKMVELAYAETGYRPARSTISAALSRMGLTEERERYSEEVPWRVRDEHQRHYALRMLRLLARRRRGAAISEVDDQRLDAWLDRLRETGAVIVYLPETDDGFFAIEGEWDSPDVPIQALFRAP